MNKCISEYIFMNGIEGIDGSASVKGVGLETKELLYSRYGVS